MSILTSQARLALAVQLDDAEHLGIPKAHQMVQEVCAYGPASTHFGTVLPYVVAWVNGMLAALRPLWEAIDESITEEAQDGIADIERHLKRQP
ncbi:hypothetical protein GCM10009555_017790 [Acrocarpospora macrocephala]|uniref:Uncharacterized protein n=1 Tax=Acrocarpospora macrocephala TaxID=150177 RepID=A0A5M3WGS4_9ACTN|nr:hypothetical protein [Acrocarpospora macrocephala]GES07439.1 hypothetical protein Amac_010340 [Acrocarpospora macrocephala]